MTAGDSIIKIRDLSTGYATGTAAKKVVTSRLSGILYTRELTCLLGPNGAGKSTLLRTLAGFQHPISGDVEVMGKNIRDYSGSELARQIGVVLTERMRVPNLTVAEMVGMGRSPYTNFWGHLDSADAAIVEDAMRMVGVETLAGRDIDSLSDGERQKVMIAKALAQETPIIFLDEPTAFLDYPSKVEMLLLLHRLTREKNKAVFLSTHDLELALQLADKAWLMDRKLGVVTGTPEDLSKTGRIGEYFDRDGIHFDPESLTFRIVNRR